MRFKIDNHLPCKFSGASGSVAESCNFLLRVTKLTFLSDLKLNFHLQDFHFHHTFDRRYVDSSLPRSYLVLWITFWSSPSSVKGLKSSLIDAADVLPTRSPESYVDLGLSRWSVKFGILRASFLALDPEIKTNDNNFKIKMWQTIKKIPLWKNAFYFIFFNARTQ